MRPRNVTEEEFGEMVSRVRGTAQRSAMTNWKDSPEANHSPMRKVSGSTVSPRHAPSPPNQFAPYTNKWELNYSKVLEMEQKVGAICSWKYAGLTFTTAYRQYHRADFIIGHRDGSVEIAQVKGYHKNLRAGIKGLKWAAQLYPMFTWTIKWWTGTGWDGKYVEV